MTICSARANLRDLQSRVRAITAARWGYDAVGDDPALSATAGRPDLATATLVSRRLDVATLASDLREVAFGLIDAGLAVRAGPVTLTVSDPGRPDVSTTFSALHASPGGTLRFPPGEILSPAVVNELYWANFYARHTYASGSSFQALVALHEDLPRVVVDLGCGDGRDSYAFAAKWRTVTGLDRSHVAIREAQQRAARGDRAASLSFRVCDVGIPGDLETALRAARVGPAPALFYLRFFLHSVSEEVQDILLGTIAECARPGDCIAAEFRTKKDAINHKVHGDHYRRYQDGPAYGRVLRDVHAFVPLLEQEGTGLSPYHGEDPHLYRVIARRE